MRISDWSSDVCSSDLARAARASSKVTRNLRNAPDRTPMVSAAMRLPDGSDSVLLMSASAREVTRQFRAERFTSAVVLAVVISASILLSLFLARPIARPLRRLALPAPRVRAGRAPAVVVPRLHPPRADTG